MQYYWKRNNARIMFWGYNLNACIEMYYAMLERSNQETVRKVLALKKIRNREEFFDTAYKLGLNEEVEGDKRYPKLRTFYFRPKEVRKEKLKKEWADIKNERGNFKTKTNI